MPPTGANVIDSFFVALGFKVDTSGAQQLKKQTDTAKQELLSLGRAVKAFATGYVVKSVVGISDTFEQNTIAISGFLEALEFSKAGAGMEDARDILQQITNDAAKLPGEAEEYIEVFRAGLPVLKGAMPGGSLKDLTAFTNRFAAIGKTLQVDAGQIGRDLSLMLGPKGRAGGNVLTFQRMLPFIRQLKGHAAETAESFNVLTQPKRLELLQEALANPALSSMLERSASSFDAMLGAAKSMVKTLVRLGTASLFRGLKDGLDALRAVFVDDSGKLTSTGQRMVEILDKVGYAIARMIRLGGIVVKTLLRFADSSVEVKAGLIGIAGALIGIQRLLRFGLLGAILLIIEDLHTFYEGGDSIVGLLKEKFPEAVTYARDLLILLGAAFVAVQGKAIIAAAGTAGAWMLANLPIVLTLGLVTALIVKFSELISKWAELKATAKGWLNIAGGKFLDAIGAPAPADATSNEAAARFKMGRDLEQIQFEKSGRVAPGTYGPAFKPGTATAAPSLGTQDALPSGTSAFDREFARAYAEGRVVRPDWDKSPATGPVTNNTTINVNGAKDPKSVVDEIERRQERRNRNTIRSSKKGHKL